VHKKATYEGTYRKKRKFPVWMKTKGSKEKRGGAENITMGKSGKPRDMDRKEAESEKKQKMKPERKQRSGGSAALYTIRGKQGKGPRAKEKLVEARTTLVREEGAEENQARQN